MSALLAAGLGLSPGCVTDAIGATPPGSSPIGVHSMLQLDDPHGFMLAMFAQAAALHASAIRLDVAPALIFTAPGAPPDFSGLDEVMALSQQYGLPVVADLTTIPWWIADCQAPTDISAMDVCGTDDLTDYGAMIGQIVAHATSVIGDWEIWNEPDNGEFFTGTPQQYAQMLGAAYATIKAVDPNAEVLLGGISGTTGMSWLTQVFSTSGTDAAQDFDIANVHERNRLDALAGDIEAWKSFLAGYGFTGPLWVTEHGYPSDPAYQYDPAFSGGEASQAAYLSASIPTLIDAGAAEVFVTERDNLTGQYASEGLLGGGVSDPPPADPLVIEKPAYLAVQTLAGCYLALGRDCPGPGPVASPASLTMTAPSPPAPASWTVTVSDPGPAPLLLGAVALTGGV
ncbi:MAG: glycosyl hydrolase, partial [Solirubrobacteraceae bacterium]